MLWLIWQMWFLLALALLIGLAAGWRIWGRASDGERRATASMREEIARLRRENDDLTRAVATARTTREAARRPATARAPVGGKHAPD